ncbi:MAG: PfkB family carbohydrate kinase [Eubacteriales bacterium]
MLTLGDKGARYSGKDGKHSFGIFRVHAVDTTAAGDTFTGFFISSVSSGKTAEEALRIASAASAIAVTRKGASPSIPTMDEVVEFLKNN